MSNYTQSTNFATKDSLPSGDPLKIVKGTEINTEFVNIAVAVATKADLASPTFTGTPAAPTASSGTNTTQLATTAFVTAATTAAIASALQAVYPVGSIYVNAGVSTNPATLLGFGTWAAFGAGRVMVGLNGSDTLFDTLEETGGSKDAIVVSHDHTTNGAGAHTHSYTRGFTGLSNGMFHPDLSDRIATGFDNPTSGTVGGIAGVGDHTHSVNSTGSSATNANLQPYITVAMWKRTA
jgi:hypothetical protein